MNRPVAVAICVIPVFAIVSWYALKQEGKKADAKAVHSIGVAIVKSSFAHLKGYWDATNKQEKLRQLTLLLRDAEVMGGFAKVPPPGSDILRDCAMTQRKYAEDCISYEESLLPIWQAPSFDQLIEKHKRLQEWLLKLENHPEMLGE